MTDAILPSDNLHDSEFEKVLERVLATAISYIFEIHSRNGLFVSDNRRDFEHTSREFALFYRVKNCCNALGVVFICSELQLFVKNEQMNTAVGVILFSLQFFGNR